MGRLRRWKKQQEQRWTAKLVQRLDEKRALRLFRALATRFRVSEVVTLGEVGRVRGRLDDEVVFGRYLREGRWSHDLGRFLSHCFEHSAGGTFVDIGANIGLMSLAVGRREHVRLECFEPEPTNLALLRENFAKAGLGERATVHPVALSDEDAELRFELSDHNRGDHRIRRDPDGAGDAEAREIRVPGRRLDGLLDPARLEHPLVVKCDAQGAELAIWAGGENFFAGVDALVIEFWPFGLARMQSDPEALIARLVGRFERGQVVAPGASIGSRWQPIEAVAEQLRAFAQIAGPEDHRDVLLADDGFAERLAKRSAT